MGRRGPPAGKPEIAALFPANVSRLGEQQRWPLVRGPSQVDGLDRIWQQFNDIAGLQVVLAVSVGREPPGDQVAVKRVVERLGKFVTEHRYVRKVNKET